MCSCKGAGFIMWTNGGTFGARACSCAKFKSDSEAMTALLARIDRNRLTAIAVSESARTGHTIMHAGYRIKVTKIRRMHR